MKNLSTILLASLFCFALLGSACAQIGEVAGPLNFNVCIGSKQSLTLTIINGGGDMISYQATPTLTTSIPNATAPQIKITPANGTIAPHSELPLNVTVYMPGGRNRAGMVWGGYISTVELANSTLVGSGANVQSGALKIMSVTAAPAKFQEIYVLIAALAITGIGMGAYYIRSTLRAKKGKRTAAMAKGGRKGAARHRAARKGKRKAGARRKKASRARRTTRRRR